jgi:benzylsuccinate CoA-transferase BbsF subunit
MTHSILHNIRILDFSWVLAGPFATRMLADFGAEVIKVQPLLPEAKDRFSQGYYNTWNRNKLGITLNLNQPEGLEIARKMVKISDAVVENFTTRVMSNWGLDYSCLKKLKPEIIMLRLSTMGHTGPCQDFVGFGPTVQAFSGITSLTAYPGKPPPGVGYSYADHIAGLHGCLALLGALEYRHKTGQGQYIDLSQTETMSALLSNAIVDYALDNKEPLPEGNTSKLAAPYGVYRCCGEDRWCAISVFTDKEWEGFKKAFSNPAWADCAEFATLAARLRNSARLDNFIEDWTKDHTSEDIMARLQKEGVAAGIVQNAADLAHDPQLKARKFFIELGRPDSGKMNADANPIKLSDTPAEYQRPAPAKGQDNDYVYHNLLGMTEDRIKDLQQKGII